MRGNSSKLSKFKPLCFATWLAMGYVVSSQAAVVVDINQGEIPGVRSNINGSITVNINSAKNGISHNKYTQFDVSKEGLILNNGTTTSSSQLAGGNVAANGKLGGNAASLIINEVTSSRSSILNGQIEVAGQKSDVIVANPAGVTCSGCGFINTGRGTLTTGTPKIENNTLVGISVKGGTITVTNGGMNDKSDYTNILATTLRVEDKINAGNLQAMTGNNSNITVDNNELVNTGGASQQNVLGIDIAALGGMYANKITLVTNGSAIGIYNRGIISANSQLNINSAGQIRNMGSIGTKGSGNSTISASRVMNDNGSIISEGDNTIVSSSGISNYKGTIQAGKSVMVNAVTVDNNGGFINGDYVSIVADSVVNTNSNLYYESPRAGIATDGGINGKNGVSINASSFLNNNAGWINSDSDSIALVSVKDMVLDYSRINAKKDIYVSSNTLDYPASKKPDPIDAHLKAGNDINFVIGNLGTFDKTTILSAGNDINISKLNNNSAGTFFNYGTLFATNNINYNHGKIENYGAIQAGKKIDIKTTDLINHNLISSFGALSINAENSIYNDANGLISSLDKITMTSPTITNFKGRIIGQNGIDLYTDKFNNTGYTSGLLTVNPTK